MCAIRRVSRPYGFQYSAERKEKNVVFDIGISEEKKALVDSRGFRCFSEENIRNLTVVIGYSLNFQSVNKIVTQF